MQFLPPSTNHDYRGAHVSAWFLMFLSITAIIPGCIHAFLPDGGASVIAGLDLTHNATQTIGLFAWAGATQIVWGLLLLNISLRNRSFVPLALALVLVERAIMALNMWALKTEPGAHHPPEAYATLALLPMIALFFALSLRARPPAAA